MQTKNHRFMFGIPLSNKISAVFFILIVFFLASCKSEDSEDTSPNFLDLKQENISLTGTVDFFIIKSFKKIDNSCQIIDSTITLSSEPLLTYSDIISYNSKTFTFKITSAGATKLKALQSAPVTGVPFAVRANERVSYTAYFWPVYSSLSCNAITVDPYKSEKEKQIVLQLGYPGYADDSNYSDERNDPNLLNILRTDNKLVE